MTKEYIIETCEEYGIENYTINDDLSIDVNGNVDLSGKGLTELPLTFNIVDGVFNCGNNNLTNLKGSPRKCRYFYCFDNKLTNLDGAPDVCGYLDCRANRLATLKGAPKCHIISYEYLKLNLDNEDIYVIEALTNHYNNKELKNYLKIRKRDEFINSILD